MYHFTTIKTCFVLLAVPFDPNGATAGPKTWRKTPSEHPEISRARRPRRYEIQKPRKSRRAWRGQLSLRAAPVSKQAHAWKPKRPKLFSAKATASIHEPLRDRCSLNRTKHAKIKDPHRFLSGGLFFDQTCWLKALARFRPITSLREPRRGFSPAVSSRPDAGLRVRHLRIHRRFRT